MGRNTGNMSLLSSIGQFASDVWTGSYQSAKTGKNIEPNTATAIHDAIKPAAAAAFAIPIAASGILSTIAPSVKAAGAAITSRATTYAAQHPIQTLRYGAYTVGGGIIAGGILKSNPDILKGSVPKTVDVLSDTGTLIGELSKSKDFGTAFGHLRTFTEEHPVATGLTLAGGAILGIKGGAGLV